MYNKRIKVIGGIREKSDETKGAQKKSRDAFTIKKVVVVEEQNIAALFRRDPYLCTLSCRTEETTDALTPGMFFSHFAATGV